MTRLLIKKKEAVTRGVTAPGTPTTDVMLSLPGGRQSNRSISTEMAAAKKDLLITDLADFSQE